MSQSQQSPRKMKAIHEDMVRDAILALDNAIFPNIIWKDIARLRQGLATLEDVNADGPNTADSKTAG